MESHQSDRAWSFMRGPIVFVDSKGKGRLVESIIDSNSLSVVSFWS